MAGFGSLAPSGANFGTTSSLEDATMPETFVNPMVKSLLAGLLTLPQRAIQNSQFSLDSGTYDPAVPVEAAMLPMGTGGIAGVPVRAGEQVLGAGAVRKSGVPAAGDEMLAMHNTRIDRLEKADNLGGLAVPSMAIAKPAHGFDPYGEISLIADQAFMKPSAKNPVFASDVYSPRFPSLNDEGTKIFRGFTDQGNRRYAPLTLDNVVREMKGNVRGGESFNYGAGNVRAAVTPQFGSLAEIKASRDRLVSPKEFEPMKDATNTQLMGLADEFHPYSKYAGNGSQHMDDFSQMLGEYANRGLRPMNEHYKDLPPELLDKARGFLGQLRDMPTQYFEGKPQRGVRIGEFKGALVPDNAMSEVAPILERNGIGRIETYTANDAEARRLALQKFKDLFFAGAGVAGPAAVGFGSLAPRNEGM